MAGWKICRETEKGVYNCKFNDLDLHGLQPFQDGLENLMGYSATKDVMSAMKHEQESGKPISTLANNGRGIFIEPNVEWNIVLKEADHL
jgi:hypothetical protein